MNSPGIRHIRHIRHIDMNPSSSNATLFGASGFIGSHVAAQLRLAGQPVITPVRRLQPLLQQLGTAQQIIDFNDDAALIAVIPQGAVVYCCLANPRRHLSLEDLRAVEVRLTARVIRAAAQAGARRVVLLSTIMVYGFDRPPRPIDEHFPPQPSPSPHPFCRVALEREQTAQQVAQAAGIDLQILRPATAIGARDQQIAKLIRSFRQGVFPRIGRENYRFSAIDARDIGRAMQLLGEIPVTTPAESIWLATGFDTSWQELGQVLTTLTGRHAHTLPLPLPLARGLGALIETFCPYRWEPDLTRFSVDVMSTHTLFDSRRLAQAGFTPRYGLQDALRDALGLPVELESQ
jgi:nucleoside-diphosphate-sugar epimerase